MTIYESMAIGALDLNDKNFDEFKKAHEEAAKTKHSRFTWKGKKINVNYAYYVIEYWEKDSK